MRVCVFGDDLPLFISDLSYATQVIQYVKPMGRLLPWSAFVRARMGHSVCELCQHLLLLSLCSICLRIVCVFSFFFLSFSISTSWGSESGKGGEGAMSHEAESESVIHT